MTDTAGETRFAGSIPELYERILVPLIFQPYANDMAVRVAALAPDSVLEVAAGTGVVTRAMADTLSAGVRITATDLVISQDIPLADRCLKKGARAISPMGKPFTADNIGMALAMRDLKAHLRETGDMLGGNPGFTRNDRSRFLQSLEQAVQDIRRGA